MSQWEDHEQFENLLRYLGRTVASISPAINAPA